MPHLLPPKQCSTNTTTWTDPALTANTIKGLSSSTDAVPVLTLTGPMAQRARSVALAGKTQSLAAKDGRVQIALPLGETTFEIALQ